MMKLQLHYKNVAEETKDTIGKLAEAKLEDLGHFFPEAIDQDKLTAACTIEESKKTPFFTVHVSLIYRHGKEQHYEAEESADTFEDAINAMKNTLRSQISQKKM